MKNTTIALITCFVILLAGCINKRHRTISVYPVLKITKETYKNGAIFTTFYYDTDSSILKLCKWGLEDTHLRDTFASLYIPQDSILFVYVSTPDTLNNGLFPVGNSPEYISCEYRRKNTSGQ